VTDTSGIVTIDSIVIRGSKAEGFAAIGERYLSGRPEQHRWRKRFSATKSLVAYMANIDNDSCLQLPGATSVHYATVEHEEKCQPKTHAQFPLQMLGRNYGLQADPGNAQTRACGAGELVRLAEVATTERMARRRTLLAKTRKLESGLVERQSKLVRLGRQRHEASRQMAPWQQGNQRIGSEESS
jgi:hypothetical protein